MPTLNWIGKDKAVNHHLDVPFMSANEDCNWKVWLDSVSR